MRITHEITLDLSRHGTQCSIPITQHDCGTRRLVVHLRNKGTAIILEERDTAALYLGGDVWDPVIVYTENGAYPNSLVYDVSAQASSSVGERRAVFQIFKTSENITYSPEIVFNVRNDITHGSAVLDSPQYAAVVKAQLVTEMNAANAQRASEQAIEAQKEAESSKVVCSEARETVVAAEQNATAAEQKVTGLIGENGERLSFVDEFSSVTAPEISERLGNAENVLGRDANYNDYPDLNTDNPAVIPAVNELLAKILSLVTAVNGKTQSQDPITEGEYKHTGDMTVAGIVSAQVADVDELRSRTLNVVENASAASMAASVVNAGTLNAQTLNVSGTAYIKNQEEILVKDNLLVLNSEGVALDGAWCGIVIRTDTEKSYNVLYDTANDSVILGYGVFDEQNKKLTLYSGGSILIRDYSENMKDGSLLFWDSENCMAKTLTFDKLLADELQAALSSRGLPAHEGDYLSIEDGRLKLTPPEKLVSVEKVEQTTVSSADGGTNVATVTLTDGSSSAFYVRNGSKGEKGEKGDKGDAGEVSLLYAHTAFANALKGKASGSVVVLDDVSPLEHEMSLKVSGVDNVGAVTLKRMGKNILHINRNCGDFARMNSNIYTSCGVTYTLLEDGRIHLKGTVTGFSMCYLFNTEFHEFLTDKSTLCFSAKIEGDFGSEGYFMGCYKTSENKERYITPTGSNYKLTVDKSLNTYLWFRIQTTNIGDEVDCIVGLQIEVNDEPTEYELYQETTYTVNADGTAEGITSLYPITTLTTDTEGALIECEYNKDLNKAIAELYNAIISLGGNV